VIVYIFLFDYCFVYQTFVVKDSVYDYYRSRVAEGQRLVTEWNTLVARYAEQYPDLAADLHRRLEGRLPADWKSKLPTYSPQEAKAAATRNRSEEVLNALASVIPEIVGGSADLTPSNLTALKVCRKVD
jgi:transketolase